MTSRKVIFFCNTYKKHDILSRTDLERDKRKKEKGRKTERVVNLILFYTLNLLS